MLALHRAVRPLALSATVRRAVVAAALGRRGMARGGGGSIRVKSTEHLADLTRDRRKERRMEKRKRRLERAAQMEDEQKRDERLRDAAAGGAQRQHLAAAAEGARLGAAQQRQLTRDTVAGMLTATHARVLGAPDDGPRATDASSVVAAAAGKRAGAGAGAGAAPLPPLYGGGHVWAESDRVPPRNGAPQSYELTLTGTAKVAVQSGEGKTATAVVLQRPRDYYQRSGCHVSQERVDAPSPVAVMNSIIRARKTAPPTASSAVAAATASAAKTATATDSAAATAEPDLNAPPNAALQGLLDDATLDTAVPQGAAIPLGGLSANTAAVSTADGTGAVAGDAAATVAADDDGIAFDWTEPTAAERKRQAYVCIVGTPNSGKSALLNRLIHERVSAVSPKRNTTRRAMLGVATSGPVQLVVHDTPGINESRDAKGEARALATTAWQTGATADLMLVLIDAARHVRAAEKQMIAKAEALRAASNGALTLVLVLNKVDLVSPKEKLLELTAELCAKAHFTDVFMIAANAPGVAATSAPYAVESDGLKRTSDGVADLEEYLYAAARPLAPGSDWEYPAEVRTDLSDGERVTELIREMLYRRTNEEVPYVVGQRNVDWRELPDGSLRIEQDVLVPSVGVLRIVTGPGGATLQAIKRAAQSEISRVFGRRVHLLLHVRVAKGDKLVGADEQK